MMLRQNFHVDENEDLPGIEGQTGPTQRFTTEGGTLDYFPGTGLPPDQVKLESTKIYANPEIHQMEADVTKARYGGKSIQDSAAEEGQGGGAPYQKPDQVGSAPVPQYDRSRFEKVIFKEIGGNPFEIDVIDEVNKVTAKDLPMLFNQVFKGQVIWEDRARMNKDQAAFWQEEVKRYRAHVKDQIDSSKKTKIDMYNFMMKNFDNEQKEHEAATKRVQERERAFLAQQREGRAESREQRLERRQAQEHIDKLQQSKRNILKRQGEILREGSDINTGALRPEAEAEFMELGKQLKLINQQSHELLMQHDAQYRAEERRKITGDVQPAHKPKAAGSESAPQETPQTVRKKIPDQPPPKEDSRARGPRSAGEVYHKPHPAGEPVEIRRNKQTGQLMGKMPDGSIVYLEELPTP